MTRTAQQTFWSDQALARAREVAGDGRTIAVVNDFPDGEQCSWCDCSIEAVVGDADGHHCTGCPQPAGSVLRVHNGTQVRRDIPVCEAHRDDAVVFVFRVLGASR
ncbi:hypothetical protein ABT063_02220 [Streptomyces sp. NPDC002838]|uniref:hypothetical protein n=1 Tax=Streptomyces sp. NPDC002838 TaxID=3154436 RepID=UPI0033180A6E